MSRSTFARSLALLVLVGGLAGCASPHAKWGYDGDTGPDHWGDLSIDYVLAKTGRQQSPIDLIGAVESDLPVIGFDYSPAAIDVSFNGHTIEQHQAAGSSIELDGKTYALAQFHFHSPSEHTVNGHHSDLEMHLVHKSADGELAVIGVMIDSGAENTAFAPLWDHLPTRERTHSESDDLLDPSALLPEDRTHFRYAGSLTTPPCTEGVRWMVMRTPVEMSAAQIEKFRAVIHGNNRPVQPLHGRTIELAR